MFVKFDVKTIILQSHVKKLMKYTMKQYKMLCVLLPYFSYVN